MLTRWVFLAVFLGVLVPYLQTLGAPFVWDDRHLIVDSSQLLEERSLASYFQQPFWVEGDSGDVREYFRPLTVLSFVADYRLHGLNPSGYHLTSSFLHALNALLLFGVLRRFQASVASAALLSLAWGLHPRLTEAAAWVSGRTDVLAGTFTLLALLVHRPRSLWRGTLSAILLLCGLLSKEVALAGLCALLALELTHLENPDSTRRTRLIEPRALLYCLPLVVSALLYMLLRRNALGETQGIVLSLTAQERAFAACEAIGRYVWNTIVPWFPRLQQGHLKQLDARFAVLGGIALFALVLGVAWSRKRAARANGNTPSDLRPVSREGLIAGAALAIASIALVLHVIPIPVSIVAADRFLYVPLMGLAIICVAPLTRAIQAQKPALIAAVLVLSSLAVATFARVGDWSNELELWISAYQHTPKTNALPGNELGNVYYRAALYPEALQIYRSAAKHASDNTFALSNVARAASQLGSYDEARRILTPLCLNIQLSPKLCLDAALIEVHELRLKEARHFIQEATRRDSEYRPARDALELLPRIETALRSPEYNATDPVVRSLARFRVAMLAGRRTEALELGKALIGLPNVSAQARREIAEYWIRFGKPDELRQVLESGGESIDDELWGIANARIEEARQLLEAWPRIGGLL